LIFLNYIPGSTNGTIKALTFTTFILIKGRKKDTQHFKNYWKSLETMRLTKTMSFGTPGNKKFSRT